MTGNVIKFPLKVVINYSTRTADKNDLAGYVEVREEDDPVWADIAHMTRKLAPVYQETGDEFFEFRYRGLDVDAYMATDAPAWSCWIIYAFPVDPTDDLEEPDRRVIDYHFEMVVEAVVSQGQEEEIENTNQRNSHQQRGAFPDCPAPEACDCRMRGYDLEMEDEDQCVARRVATALTRLGDSSLITAMLGEEIAKAISKD